MQERAEAAGRAPTGIQIRYHLTTRSVFPAILAFLLFSFATTITGFLSLDHAARYYDFRAFYAAGYLLLHHPSQLFDLASQGVVQDALVAPIHPPLPYYHPAFEALLYAPLALFTYRTAYILYAVFNLLLFAVCYFVAPRPYETKIPRPLLFFLSFPAFFCVTAGQDSMLFLLLLCLIWRALERDDDVPAGILLALGLFKLQLVVAMVFFLVLRRGLRLLRSFVPPAIAVALLSLAITGPRGAVQWIQLLTSAIGALHQGRHEQVLIAVHPLAMPTLNGLTYMLGGRFLPAGLSAALNFVLLIASVLAAAIVVRRSKPLSDAFAACIAAALLVSPHLYLYDYVLLLPAILLLSARLQTITTSIYCALPLILFKIHGIDWLAPMALLPITILPGLLLQRSPLPDTKQDTEKVTPHPITTLQ